MTRHKTPTVRAEPPASVLEEMFKAAREERATRRVETLKRVVDWLFYAYVFLGATAGLTALVVLLVLKVR